MINTTTLVSAIIQVIILFGVVDSTTDMPSPPVATTEQTSTTVAQSQALNQLQAQIDEILTNPLLQQAHVGVKIVSLKNGKTLYSYNADKLYIPASIMKVITTATALVKLKPEYRFRTVLYADPVDQTQPQVRQNLYLKGFGDPTLRTHHLSEMVEELTEQGVTEITGDILVDESFFDSQRKGRGWMWDDGPFGGAYSHLSALSLNHNGVVVQLAPNATVGKPVEVTITPTMDHFIHVENNSTTVGRREHNTLRLQMTPRTDGQPGDTLLITGSMRQNQQKIGQHADISEPALYAGYALASLLKQKSIDFQGTIQYGNAPKEAQEIAIHYSSPLSKIIARTNKESDNFYAETLLKTLAAERISPPGTARNGIKVIDHFFKELGIQSRYEIADGSGVSRYNLVTASMFTDLLVAMFQKTSVMSDFLMSLPAAGREGTMKYRMRGLASEGVARAKTGTMTGVNSLAGYNKTADNELVAFTIIVNNYVTPHRLIRLLQDQIVNALSSFKHPHPHQSNTTTPVSDTPEAVAEPPTE